jgi:Proteasome subunit
MQSSLVASGNPCILHDVQKYDLQSGEVSSGTTIMAVATEQGVILGADSRVSTGTYIANRVSDKIAQLSPHIYCCRSGSAADTQWLTDLVKHFLAQLAYVYICYLLRSHFLIASPLSFGTSGRLFDVSQAFCRDF